MPWSGVPLYSVYMRFSSALQSPHEATLVCLFEGGIICFLLFPLIPFLSISLFPSTSLGILFGDNFQLDFVKANFLNLDAN